MEIADSLRVHSKSGDSDSLWRSWCIVQDHSDPNKPHLAIGITYVVQGPFSIIVTGDLASMVFERPGGLALGFVNNMSQYVHEKCMSGPAQWEYSSAAAEETILGLFDDAIDEIIDDLERGYEPRAEELVDDVFDLIDDVQGLDLDDEHEVGQWVYDCFGPDDLPHVGRVSSHEFHRARACILTAYRYETKETSP